MTGCTLCRARISPHENKRKQTAGVYLASDFFQCRLYSHMLPSSSFTVTPAASGLQRAFLGRLYWCAYMYVCTCIYLYLPTYIHTYINKNIYQSHTLDSQLAPDQERSMRGTEDSALQQPLFWFGLSSSL